MIAPEGVERLRANLDDESARVVSVMAYAGLRPEEMRALKWRHVGDRSIRVEFACEAGVNRASREASRGFVVVWPGCL